MSINFTCPKCRHRHPAFMSCAESQLRAELNRKTRQESDEVEPTELELLRALMQSQIDALTSRVDALDGKAK